MSLEILHMLVWMLLLTEFGVVDLREPLSISEFLIPLLHPTNLCRLVRHTVDIRKKRSINTSMVFGRWTIHHLLSWFSLLLEVLANVGPHFMNT